MRTLFSRIRSKISTLFSQNEKPNFSFFKNERNFLSFKEKYMKWPNSCQWKKILKILSKKEKIALFVLIFLLLGSISSLATSFWLNHTKSEPASGGKYTEGVIGQPRFVNPIYASTNDADRDLVELVFSGLVKYDGEGKIVPDLTESFEIKDDGKTYEFYLKDNIFWHDGKKLSAEDIIFTITTVQNPDYKSPLRANWLGVETEEVDTRTIRLKLKSPYSSFLENCTLKILPKHIWQNIPAEKFPLTIYNLQPIGTGPFKFKEFKQDKSGYIKSYTLVKNSRYFNKRAYLDEIRFAYFNEEKDATKALKNKKIDGLSYFTAEDSSKISGKSFNLYRVSLPRYFAVFFNSQKSKTFQDKNIREALNYGTNRQDIIDKVLFGQGEIVYSPILPEIFGFSASEKNYSFDQETAQGLLDKAGYKDNDGDGYREKTTKQATVFQFKSELKKNSQGSEVTELQKCLAKYPDIYPSGKVTGNFGAETEQAVINFQEKYPKEILEPAGLKNGTGTTGSGTRAKLNELCGSSPAESSILQFSLATINQPEMIAIAELLQENWKNTLGIKVNIELYDKPELEKDIIKPRNYESLLFGEVLGMTPDLFSFWHSSQKKDPGLNLSSYENKNADKLLEDARQTLDEKTRKDKYEQLQKIIINDVPAVFLYTPDYLYPVSKDIKGVDVKIIVDPSKRFSSVENWYTETKRIWK